MLIPILSIEKIFASLVAFFVALKSRERWQKEKLLSFDYLFKGMLWLGIFCATFVVIFFVSTNLYLVQGLWMFADFCALVSFAYFFSLALIFSDLERFCLFAKKLFLILAFLVLIAESFFFKKAITQTYPIPFSDLTGISWASSVPSSFKIWFGITTLLVATIFTPLIVKRVLTLVDPVKRKKGIFVALGFLGLSLACVWFWLLRPMLGISFWIEVLQGLFCVSGQLFFALGMFLKKK